MCLVTTDNTKNEDIFGNLLFLLYIHVSVGRQVCVKVGWRNVCMIWERDESLLQTLSREKEKTNDLEHCDHVVIGDGVYWTDDDGDMHPPSRHWIMCVSFLFSILSSSADSPACFRLSSILSNLSSAPWPVSEWLKSAVQKAGTKREFTFPKLEKKFLARPARAYKLYIIL